MDNTARVFEEKPIIIQTNNQFDVNNSNSGKRWYYIDLEDFEFQIRQDERIKEYNRRKSARENKKKSYEKKHKAFKHSLLLKLSGMLLIILTVTLIKSGLLYDSSIGITDGTVALITMPLSFLLMFIKNQ